MAQNPPQDRLHQVPEEAKPALLAVVTDFIGLPGPPGTLTSQYRAFVAGEPPGGEAEVLGVTSSHSFRLVVGEDSPHLAVRAASIMQDDVMDELGVLWPELVTASAATTNVLEPVISDSGVAQWQSGDFTCPIGELRQTFGHLIRRT
jgi:hypothetical protein